MRIKTACFERDSAFWALAGDLERGIPLAEEPFTEMAARLGISASFALDMAREMRDSGLMRRFGVFFYHRKLGYAGYLFGVSAPGGAESEIAERLCGMPYVTHVYERKHALNLWFTVLSKRSESVGEICGRLRSSGREFVVLRASKVIKLRPSFVGISRGEPYSGPLGLGGEPEKLDSNALRMVRAAALVSEISERPFADAARLSGMEAAELLDGLRGLCSRGIVRRVGASFDHYRAGWRSNSLCAFDLSGAGSSALEAVYAAVFDLPWASHCYIRELYDCELSSKWPYNLYVMVHAVSDGELGARERYLLEVFGGARFVSLRTRREIKHTHFGIFGEERGRWKNRP
jgi:DNA-binding Lrp family transcriptional regulator